MFDRLRQRNVWAALICLALLILLAVVIAGMPAVSAQEGGAPSAACAGGPEIDGEPLDECLVESFDVGGVEKSITVWYTKDQTPRQREHQKSVTETEMVVVTNWLASDAEAQQIADWGREAWEKYFEVFAKSPRDTGPNCDDNIDLWVYDTYGPCFAPWPDDINDCRILINAPDIRSGTGQEALHHEFHHYLQYAYNDGCYDFLKANYNRNAWYGDAEFVEGYADLAHDIVDQGLDDKYFDKLVERHVYSRSLYIEGYWNLFTKYFAEQLGTEWNITEPEWHMDAVREHYEACDAHDTLYVLDTLVPNLTGGALTMEELVLNFYAANYAYEWVDMAEYPELYYVDPDPPPYGSVVFRESENLNGALSWHGDFFLTEEDGLEDFPGGVMPQEWAADYYRVYPEAGCEYVTAQVDGEAGARLGINLMAVEENQNSPGHFRRFAWIGEDFSRTFARRSNNFSVVAVVNSFASAPEFDVTFTCVDPEVRILEPRQASFALVGDPTSPDTFLLRFKVFSDGSAVRGLQRSDFEVQVGGEVATLVPNTFQEVGEEYWAIVNAPVMDVGTTWADVWVKLDNFRSDTETNAVLYVDPGHNDVGLLFDASDSMDTEDMTGEGRRYENAQKAGTVLADLLRDDDRVLVMDFSATGVANPVYDIRTLLPRTDVIVPGTIDDAKAAISQISPRGRTPIGKALQEAKDKLVVLPASYNPKYIVLLSDGEENTVPLYAEVRDEIVDSGVKVDTVAFSGDANEPLMAQIAADTGGTYRYVPTSLGTAATVSAKQIEWRGGLGLPDGIASRLATPLLPGPLGLDEVYDYFETKNQAASRLFLEYETNLATEVWAHAVQYVDSSATRLRLVVASKQPVAGNTFRHIEVQPPGASDWTIVSGVAPDPVPTGWSVRGSTYDHVIVISDPAPGIWRVRARGEIINLTQATPNEATFDFMLSGSVQSSVRLQGRFLAPIADGQGMMGDHVPIVATLLDGSGGVTGAQIVAQVNRPGESTINVDLHDDGNHSDGAAGDGIYGTIFSLTSQGGSYNVRLVAAWQEGGSGEWLTREWSGAFWLDGLQGNDSDGDNMPDSWEDENGLDSTVDDADDDLDMDRLTNIQELQEGTRPNQPDTDHGGENDRSEVLRNRDPLDPEDDAVDDMGIITTIALNGTIVIYWPYPDSFSDVLVFVSTDPDDEGTSYGMGTTGVFSITGLSNDQIYYLRFIPIGLDGLATGHHTPPVPVTPKADPDAPTGMIRINDGARFTSSPNVTLSLYATDIPLEGPAFGGSGAVSTRWTRAYNEVSGGLEMIISNNPSLKDGSWEPYVARKPWMLDPSASRTQRVYAQFRDAAGNYSFVVWDDIALPSRVYLPLVFRTGP